MASGRATVVNGTAYETLVLLYRQVQADYGLTPLGSEWSDVALPGELHAAADRFFCGDIALGMNVIPFAHVNRWHALGDLVAGLERTDPVELAVIMLRSPDATPAEHRRRDQEIPRILSGDAARHPLLAALHEERFDTSAAEVLLDDPQSAAREFIDLLRTYSSVVVRPDVEDVLSAGIKAAQALIDELPIDAAAMRLFPQWRLEDLAEYASLVLIPSAAITPYVSTRLTPNDQALIVFPAPSGDEPILAELASALKALAHPLRLEILRLVAQAPTTGQELAQSLGLTEATVHHHTTLLRAVGFLVSHRDAHRVYLTAVPEAVDLLICELHRVTHTDRVRPYARRSAPRR